MKRMATFLVLTTLVLCASWPATYAAAASGTDTVILSSKDDPYYALAEEISAAEGIPIYQTFEEATEAKPVFLLWVVAPERLSESTLMDVSNELAHLNTSISMGIISGKTLEDARRLWRGSSQVPGSDVAIINGTKENKIDPEIIYGSNSRISKMELTMENILAVLQSAEAIQISLEGAAGSWFDKSLGIIVKSADIPELNSCVIQHYGCDTFRLWEENSIALECISKGAIAYCGFVYSSVAGTRFGDYTDISTIYTWDEFPLGHLVQIQNHAAMQSYADMPHYFMLGDPRLYYSAEAPYQVISDETSGDTRTIELINVRSGLIPISIKGGAAYNYASVSGLTSSTMDSAYFNRRLQMIDINADKYIIIDNDSPTVTIELQRRAPFFWALANRMISFGDSVIAENQVSNLPMLLSLPLLILFMIAMIRRRYAGRELASAFLFGLFAALLATLYILVRLNDITVTNIPIKMNWLNLFSILIYAGYGALLYIRAQKPMGKIVAVLAANLYPLMTFVLFAGASLIKLMLFGNAADINKAGYPWLFAFKELIAGIVLLFASYGLFTRLWVFRRKQGQASRVEAI